jgi:hypothetical protein
MRFESIAELQHAIVRCPLECPYRNEAPGYYPKPPRGPANFPVMIVFENPGSPGGRNLSVEQNPELAFSIANITLPEALRLAIPGQQNWLFRSNQLEAIRKDVTQLSGFSSDNGTGFTS